MESQKKLSSHRSIICHQTCNWTILITNHALEEAEVLSSRLFILSEGIMPFTGTSTELREQFKCGYELRVELNSDSIQNVLDFFHF